jgi:hypothetical protein
VYSQAHARSPNRPDTSSLIRDIGRPNGSRALRRYAIAIQFRELAGELWPLLLVLAFLGWGILGFIQQ